MTCREHAKRLGYELDEEGGITNCGEFEGEHCRILYFVDCAMDGAANDTALDSFGNYCFIFEGFDDNERISQELDTDTEFVIVWKDDMGSWGHRQMSLETYDFLD